MLKIILLVRRYPKLASLQKDSETVMSMQDGYQVVPLKSTPVKDWMCGNEFVLTDREI